MVYHLFDFVNDVMEELIARPRQHEEVIRKINEKVRKKGS